jgi:tRNA(Ile)-lysidine synthase
VPVVPEAIDNQALGRSEAEALLSAGLSTAQGILVAVSGGPDSMALLALLCEWSGGKLKLRTATIDHGLRPESADEAALVEAFANSLNVPHATLRWVGGKPTTGIQNAARNARYALLAEHADQVECSHIVTAHHADDQAETVLMRLIAGSGIHGLAGMRGEVQRDGFVLSRPFLHIPKSRLIATCAARNIPYVTDPSNNQERYGRVRVRRLLSQLEQEGLTVARLCKLAARAAQADDALAQIAEKVFSSLDFKVTDCILQFQWGKIIDHPKDIRLRVLAEAMRRCLSLDVPLKLEKMEVLLADIDRSFSKQLRTRRTLSDLVLTLQSSGLFTITTAPKRSGGRKTQAGTVLDQE